MVTAAPSLRIDLQKGEDSGFESPVAHQIYIIYVYIIMGWIGVDLDGTLADNDFRDAKKLIIGEPIPKMVQLVKDWLKQGYDIRIFTARVSNYTFQHGTLKQEIEEWCLEHIGQILPITNVKDGDCLELWDDRAVAVKRNTGEYYTENPWVLTRLNTSLLN